MLGWLIGVGGKADRQVTYCCLVGAILPDIDAIPYIFGVEYYDRFHHTFGHNVFLWALFSLGMAWKFRSLRAFILGAVAFGSHLLTDFYMSGWVLHLLWPFSMEGWLSQHAVDLGHPANIYAIYAGIGLVIVFSLLFHRTPLELFSRNADSLVISAFGRKTLACSSCGKACNQRCSKCGSAVCFRHGVLAKKWKIVCSLCNSTR